MPTSSRSSPGRRADLRRLRDDGSDPIGELSNTAIKRYGLAPDAVQKALVDGLNRFLDPRADAEREGGRRTTKRQNGGAIGQDQKGLRETPQPDASPAVAIVPTPYRYRPPSEIPRRQWLYANHYLRGAVTGTIAPGGFTKSLRSLTEIIAMVTCRNLLGVEPGTGKLRGWYWNGEDPRDEIERRIAAICKHYGIDAETELGGLFYDSGHDMPIKIATAGRGGVVLGDEAINQISASIASNGIDVAVFDPLISLHSVTEADNSAMDNVVKIFGRIAGQTNCAIDLDHHTRKLGPGQAEVTIDDSRGASASAFAFRSARIINRMSPKEADDLGLSRVDRRSYFRIEKPKANYTAPEDAAWCHVVPVNIDNGDIVGVPEPWTYPDAFADVSTTDMNWIRTLIISGGEYRTSAQAKDWIGVPLAERLKLNLDSKTDKAKVRRILKTWFKNNVLATEDRKDENRKTRQYVVLGTWKPDDTTTPPDTDIEP
jgi:hypothetical protein